MNVLAQVLEDRGWFLADGATGTNLFDIGLEAGEAPELWNVDAPEKVKSVYKGAIDAGSDIILTNTFGGTSARLKLHKAENRVKELNERAARLARDVVESSGRSVLVAGSVGPTGDLLHPVGTLTEEEAAEIFSEQIEGLLEGGVDLIWAETISSAEEFRAVAAAVAKYEASWCGTMSFDTAGRTMMGVTAPDMVQLVNGLQHKPLAFGANCGTGASDLLRTIIGFTKANPSVPLIAKGNAGIPKFVDGHVHYDGTPELMGDYAVLARDCGAAIIGGCCGTRPLHLAEMKRRLLSDPKGSVPDLDIIQERLGAFSSSADGTEDAAQPTRKRRRRRG